jgi:CRP/FNR family cyclic AMP-dependent transcriptional regulator
MFETLEPYLSDHPFLKGMPKNYIEEMVGCASNVRFDEGQYVFREGDESTHFYFIRHGKLAIELFRPNKGALVVQTLGPGDVLSWSWLFPPHYRNLDCRAVELTRAIALDGKCMLEKLNQDRDLALEIMKRFSHIMEQELEALRLNLADMYGS